MDYKLHKLKYRWYRIKQWCKANEIACMVYIFTFTVTVMTVAIINCPI